MLISRVSECYKCHIVLNTIDSLDHDHHARFHFSDDASVKRFDVVTALLSLGTSDIESTLQTSRSHTNDWLFVHFISGDGIYKYMSFSFSSVSYQIGIRIQWESIVFWKSTVSSLISSRVSSNGGLTLTVGLSAYGNSTNSPASDTLWWATEFYTLLSSSICEFLKCLIPKGYKVS